jgi:OmcA/MtrC family decaheme c-type cytochrome
MRTRASKIAILLVLFFMAAAFGIAALAERTNGSQSVRALQRETNISGAEAGHTRTGLTGTVMDAAVPSDRRQIGKTDDDQIIAALQKESYISEAEASYIRPGLKIIIQDVTIPADRRPVVTVKYTDNLDQPLDRLGVLTPGPVSSSFILAYLPASKAGEVTDYVAYTTRSVTTPANSPRPGVQTIQAGADSGGTWTEIGGGVYTYRFGTTLPANYDTARTHTLGIYGRRDLREWGLSFYAGNPTKDFVPNGSPVTQIHDIAVTASCNQCHDPLALHGETGRREVQVCVLCHTPQTIDPDTGNTQDMKVLIHKIHRSSSLPSVIAGTPYIIIGNSQSVNDFSNIAYPMDIRNCDSCHKNSKQVNAWKLFPSAEACGSCHDNVNFATGENHGAGPADNSQCASCHQPEGQYEFDASVAGAHTVPYKSKQLLLPKLTVQSLTNTGPGQKPTLVFTIKDRNGNAIDPARFSGTTGQLRANFVGPTADYNMTPINETITGATFANGVATYTFKAAIPATAAGSWALELEGRLNATLIMGGDPAATLSQRDALDNVVKYFAVTGTTVTPRRTVVSLANCNKCHEKLQLHGSNRNTIEACVVCHNPSRTGGTGAAAESISMQWMVHKIHRGEAMAGDYVLGSTSFKEVLYPGDLHNCAACHVGSTYTVPLPATNVATVTPKNYWSPTQPIAAACLGCHDRVSSAAHAFINTTTLGTMQVESCEVCHKETADKSVSKSHAR